MTTDGREADGGDDGLVVRARRRSRLAQPAHQRRDSRVAVVASAAAQQAAKREPKVLGAERVDKRIDGRVAVAEPEEDHEQNGWRTVHADDAQSSSQTACRLVHPLLHSPQ